MTSLAINPTESSQIFNKGFRGSHAKKGDVKGRGIGLFIVKQAMQLIGGDANFKQRTDKEQIHEGRIYRENYFHLKFNEVKE